MKPFLVLATALSFASACYSDDDDQSDIATTSSDVTIADCDALNKASPAFGSCSTDAYKWDKLDAAGQKKMCATVRDAALSNATNKDCSDGWLFGPNKPTTLLDDCIKGGGDRKQCRLDAPQPDNDKHKGWPAGDGHSECLNDWVVKCTDSYPAEMGIKANGAVCFVPGIDLTRLPASSWTGREMCQRLVGPDKAKQFPKLCDASVCKPKPKAKVEKKGKNLVCAPAPTPDPTPTPTTTTARTLTPTSSATGVAVTCYEEWLPSDCTPDGVSCIEECTACAEGDTDPACVPEDECVQSITGGDTTTADTTTLDTRTVDTQIIPL